MRMGEFRAHSSTCVDAVGTQSERRYVIPLRVTLPARPGQPSARTPAVGNDKAMGDL